jgi:ribosomal protein S6--L-glutamate ligase
LIQSYVPNPGEDVRMFVVGNQVVGAMVRKAGPAEWRSNIHLGGRGIPYQNTDTEGDMAVRAAEAVGLEIAGVDMIMAKDGPYLIEVNASPGFKGLMKATDVDVPGKIIEYAVEKARK